MSYESILPVLLLACDSVLHGFQLKCEGEDIPYNFCFLNISPLIYPYCNDSKLSMDTKKNSENVTSETKLRVLLKFNE